MKWIFHIYISMKFPINYCYDISYGWSHILKVPKISSLQCLYNISKNKLEVQLIFCMQINIKFPTSLFQHFGCENLLSANTIFTDWHDQAFSKYQKVSSKKKSVATAFLFYCDAKRSDILRDPTMFLFCYSPFVGMKK